MNSRSLIFVSLVGLSAIVPNAAAREKVFVPIPESQWIQKPRTECSESDGRVTIKRDHGLRGSGVHSRVALDGVEVSELKPGQILSFCVNPEEHIFGVSWNILGGLSKNKREMAVDVRPGKEYRFRVFVLHAQGATIERTAD